MQNKKSSTTVFDDLQSLCSAELEEVNKIILNLAKSKVELIPTISNYLTQSGGKRIRPLLTLACGKLVDADMKKVVKLAAAIELIHTATLFHDDVIDESPTRRGNDSANLVWGNKTVILVGDFLLSQAFKLMVETENLKTLETLSNASIEITEAEVFQLTKLGTLDMSDNDYFQLIDGKTSALFKAACASPALVSSNPEDYESLIKFGKIFGRIFQITDDLLDYTATSNDFGKKLGNDFREQKVTLPLIEIIKRCTESEKEKISKLFSEESGDISFIRTLISKYETADEIRLILQQLYTDALIILETFSNRSVANMLSNLLEEIINRQK